MSKRAVIVDDVDQSINYVGNSWKSDQGSHDLVGNYGPPFMSTLHGTDSSASLSFEFSGTSFKVYGSTDIRNNSAVMDPKWDCFIDQQVVSASPTAQSGQNSQHFCEGPLADGRHTLTVNVAVAQSQTFWLDRIEYVPSPTVSLENSLILVESNDAKFRYGQGWNKIMTENMTQTNGALFEFGFIGISISWISWILAGYPQNATTGTYTIDGGPPQTFNINGHATTTTFNQKLFETPTLPMGQHNLSVKYNGNENTSPLILDFLIIRNGSSTGTTTLPPIPSDHPLPTKQSNVGAIVGGVVAPVGVIIILILVFVLYRQRRRSHESNIPIVQVEPFQDQPSIHPSSLTWGHSPNSIHDRSDSPHGSSGSALQRTVYTRASDGGVTSSNSAFSSSHTALSSSAGVSNSRSSGKRSQMAQHGSQPSNSEDTSLRVVRHEDSGRRGVHRVHGPTSGDVIEIPPQYTPA